MEHLVLVADRLFGPTAIERRARLEANVLIDLGARVTAVTDIGTDDPGTLGRRDGFDVVDTDVRGSRSVTRGLSILRRSAPAVAKALAGRPDAVMCHGSLGLVAAARPAHRRGVPVGFTVHALIQDRIRSGANPSPPASTTLYRICDRTAVLTADLVVGVSRYMSRVAVALGADPATTTTLHNPVDTKRFRPGREPGGSDGPDVLYVGRLTVDKGIDDLIAAAEVLGPEVRISVIGSGHRRAELESRVRRGAVRFHGWVDNDDLPTRLGNSRLVVVPSRNEPQGVATLEALACGVPVIATRAGGLPEMVKHGENGWLVPPADPAALALRVRAALADPELAAVGARARASAEQFSTDAFRWGCAELYEQLARGDVLVSGSGLHR